MDWFWLSVTEDGPAALQGGVVRPAVGISDLDRDGCGVVLQGQVRPRSRHEVIQVAGIVPAAADGRKFNGEVEGHIAWVSVELLDLLCAKLGRQ
eukprot:13220811-Alexandrium_andersonii.AAC.1